MNAFWPYLILYAATFMEGELAALSGAFASRLGVLDYKYAFIAIFFGTVSIDWLAFFAGRILGEKIFVYFPKLEKNTVRTRKWINDNSSWNLILYRFLYGLRIVTLVLFGINKVKLSKFIPLSLLVIFIWTLIYTLIGYYMGAVINDNFLQLEDVGSYFNR
jgi:membrane protein DedA with SNARE-associated domain